MKFKKEELVKSPLNYTGGKFKLLPQILPMLPNDIDTFIDLFGGGLNVGVNVKANKIIYNDIEFAIVDLLKEFSKNTSDTVVNKIKYLIDKYDLSKTNKEGYLKLREYYNKIVNTGKLPDWDIFYTLICYAFNNQIRFNSKGEYNMPFGTNRSSFNPTLENRLIKFVDKLNELNIEFFSKDFVELSDSFCFSSNDFVYCDPPYLVTCATYNEQGGWNEAKERQLLDMLDNLNSRGIRFALSNVLENKGKKNDMLTKWIEDNKDKYKVHYLNISYGNCNYHAKDKSKNNTVEVLITNY